MSFDVWIGSDSSNNLIKINELPSCQISQNIPDIVIAPRSLDKEAASAATDLGRQKKSVSIPLDILDKLFPMGYSEDQIRCAFEGVSKSSRIKEYCPALLHDVLNHLQNEQVHSLDPDFEQNLGNTVSAFIRCTSTDIGDNCGTIVTSDRALLELDSSSSAASELGFSTMRTCTSSDYSDCKPLDANGPEGNMKPLAMPPQGFGLKFEDVYDVILTLDDREQFAKNSRGSDLFLLRIFVKFWYSPSVTRRQFFSGRCLETEHIYLNEHGTGDRSNCSDFLDLD